MNYSYFKVLVLINLNTTLKKTRNNQKFYVFIFFFSSILGFFSDRVICVVGKHIGSEHMLWSYLLLVLYHLSKAEKRIFLWISVNSLDFKNTSCNFIIFSILNCSFPVVWGALNLSYSLDAWWCRLSGG
jgi:hypothetical protein